jgi:hypothetical protein
LFSKSGERRKPDFDNRCLFDYFGGGGWEVRS